MIGCMARRPHHRRTEQTAILIGAGDVPPTAQKWNMPEKAVRDQIRDLVEELPPDAAFEDAIERLVFLAKLDAGLAELNAGKGVPHEEVKRRLGLRPRSFGRRKPFATSNRSEPSFHGSRLRAAHRRRRPEGRDARGAPWRQGISEDRAKGRTAVVSTARSRSVGPNGWS